MPVSRMRFYDFKERGNTTLRPFPPSALSPPDTLMGRSIFARVGVNCRFSVSLLTMNSKRITGVGSCHPVGSSK